MGSFINIKVASLNCRGLNDRTKRKSLFEHIEKSDYTVILLQETKIDPSQHRDIVREWTKGPILLNSIFGKQCGTAVLFNTSQVKVSNDIYNQDSRVIQGYIFFKYKSAKAEELMRKAKKSGVKTGRKCRGLTCKGVGGGIHINGAAK